MIFFQFPCYDNPISIRLSEKISGTFFLYFVYPLCLSFMKSVLILGFRKLALEEQLRREAEEFERRRKAEEEASRLLVVSLKILSSDQSKLNRYLKALIQPSCLAHVVS